MHCWCWCDGWRPDLWPTYDALYSVPDWDIAIDLMQGIRAHVRRQDHPQR